jgi:hypothetical protein
VTRARPGSDPKKSRRTTAECDARTYTIELAACAIPLFNNLQVCPSPCAQWEASAALEKPQYRKGCIDQGRGKEETPGP